MAKTLGMVFGVVFVLVGILGFIPNPIVGSEGFFMADLVHNLIHVVIGIVLIVAARKSDMAAVKSLKVIAILYAVLALVGFVQFGASNDSGMLLGLAGANAADNWLHLVLAVVLWVAAMMAGKKGMSSMGAPMGGQQM